MVRVALKKVLPHLTPALSPPSDGAEREKALRPLPLTRAVPPLRPT